MKKTLILLGVITIFALSGFARAEGTGLTAKGIKACVNLSKYIGSDAEDNKFLFGLGGGAFIEYSFSPQLAVQPEALFMMKGDKAKQGDEKNRLTYIEIPVLLKFKPVMKVNFKPAVFAGPAVGLLLSAKADEYDEGGDLVGNIDIKDGTKTIDFGIVFGAGFMYMLQNSGGITFDVRYTMGLTKLDDTETALNYKNANISFMIGYSF